MPAWTRIVLLAAIFHFSPSTIRAAEYRLDLELNPAAPFPFLAKFGSVALSVSPDGVAGNALVLRGFSRTGSNEITVMHRLARLYVDIPIAKFRTMLLALSSSRAAIMPDLGRFPVSKPVRGRVGGLEALRYRIQLGPQSSIDVWTTTAVPRNPHYLRLAHEFAKTISDSTAELARQFEGMPIHIELNTTHHKKVALLRLKRFVPEADSDPDLLRVGRLYVRAPGSEALLN